MLNAYFITGSFHLVLIIFVLQGFYLNTADQESEFEDGTKPSEQKSGADQQDQTTHAEFTAPPPSVNPNDEDCVTIMFHALLSPDFNFKEEEHKIAIRAGHPELHSFAWNCVEITPIR